MVYVLTAVFVVLVLFQISGAVKQKQYKALIISLFLLSVALLYGYAEILGWTLPEPTDFINTLYEPVSDYVFKELLK